MISSSHFLFMVNEQFRFRNYIVAILDNISSLIAPDEQTFFVFLDDQPTREVQFRSVFSLGEQVFHGDDMC